ncbi:hypothetical protein V1520DRAFT_340435 [Lipomyces starkeyi]
MQSGRLIILLLKVCTLTKSHMPEDNLSLQGVDSTSVQVRNGSGGGIVLLQDTRLIETLAHISRERIPER